MSTRKAIITTILTLAMLAIATTQASAHVTRELTGTIDGSLEGELSALPLISKQTTCTSPTERPTH